MTAIPIKVLLVEDDEEDFYLTRELLRQIREAAYELDWVDNADEALAAVNSRRYDACLIDYKLGPDSGVELIEKAIGAGGDTPMILLTGDGDRAVDVKAMKSGAADFLVKGQANAAMVERAIRYAIERKRAEREREDLLRQLQSAVAEVKTLSGLLPICTSCKRIRDEQGHWDQLEEYIRKHSQAEFSHGVCLDCFKTLYPDYSPE